MESPAAAYYFNGSICCFCFLIGTFGNIVSFLYFKSKKRDISNVIYMLITANDIVVSITVLPVGISFLSQGKPGIIFGNKYGCVVWDCIWRVAVSLSVFLVLCLCITRTMSLLTPFKIQKIRYLLIALTLYFVINLARTLLWNFLDSAWVQYFPERSRCDTFVDIHGPNSKAALYFLDVINNIFYTTPAIVVVISCVISVVVLTRKNRNVQQRELQQSRNRATVTILLFALLYAVCNIPLVSLYVAYVYCLSINNFKFISDFKDLDKHAIYMNATKTLLLAANSAANPILYFWRMPALREYIMSGIRRMLGLNREVRRPVAANTVQEAETVFESINIDQRIPASRECLAVVSGS